MKNIFKILTISVALLTAIAIFTSCDQLIDDPKDFFEYWTSEVIPKGFSISGPQPTNSEGTLCVPSGAPVTVTINLHNPRKFKLVMPRNPTDAQNIIHFPGFSGYQPEYSSPGSITGDYTLKQTADDKLELTYKSPFLKKHEWSSKNIGPEITLISIDGRKFSKKFSLNLKVDTPPKLSSTVTIGKTTKDGKHYYVIILKADEMSETAGVPSELLHKEIKTLSVTHGTGDSTPLNIAFTGTSGFPTGDRLLASSAVSNLGIGEGPGTNSSLNTNTWALRYRTDTEVKTASKTYTFTLIDAKGLKSSPITVPTPLLKAEDVKLYKNPSDPSTEITTLNASASSPYIITVAPGTHDVIVTAKTETAGATISGSVKKHNGSGWVDEGSEFIAAPNNYPIALRAEANSGGTIQYKISLTAGGIGFDNSNEKIFYVTVKTNDTTTISSSDPNAWGALKHAVENTSYMKIKINGTIIAPSGAEKIEVKRDVTIEGNTGSTTDKLDANNRTYIFDISGNGNLKLEKLTLQRGKNTDPYSGGGAIYCAGATLTTDNVIIESCEATKHGGAIYAKEVFVSVNTEPSVITLNKTQIKGCKAEESGGAIYCKKSTLTLNNTTIGGMGAGNTAKIGGGIYFDFEGGKLDVSAESFISYNEANKVTGVTVGGGGVYIQGGEFVLNGEVSDNKALSIPNGLLFGGGVYVGPKAKFIMNAGAKISGNKAPAGAGVYISAFEGAGAGSFTMEGGEISGCHAGGLGFTKAQGGGVYIKADGEKKGSFTMKGGRITGCTTEANTANEAAGGGVYADVETVFQMSGGAVITPSTDPNTLTKSFNDVYLHDVTYAASIIVTDELTSTPAVARLTMKDLGSTPGVDSGYTVGRVVVKGASVDTPSSYILKPTDAAKFQVTPQRGVTPAQNWKVVHDGSSSGTLQLDP